MRKRLTAILVTTYLAMLTICLLSTLMTGRLP
jgi:hypothetical protein